MSANQSIVVIGAGIVGLSTAVCLQNEFPSSKITVIAEGICDDTLSSGAGGIFRPEVNVHWDSERVRKWCEDSHSYFLEILSSPNASDAGVQLMPGYHLSKTLSQVENSFLKSLLSEYRSVTEEELNTFPGNFKYGVFFITPVIDCRYYLPWMKKRFEENGGKLIIKHVSSFSELSNYDVIFNCSGLGAKNLTNDAMLLPIRGQTIKVKAPWIKHFYYGNEVYIIPGVDYVTLGGVKDYGCWNTEVNNYQKQYIWDKCVELVPSLMKASIAWEWVGLRPYRSSVRVEASLINCDGTYKLIVHNYGHGGHGVALSWGTAMDAVKIFKHHLSKAEYVISKL